MTTIIDWTKAPCDATHAGIFDNGLICWYKDIKPESYKYMYANYMKWGVGENQPANQSPIKRPTKPEIDLKTINVTFGELDLETQLRLAKHVLQSGKVARFINGEWINYGDKLHFSYNIKYRAAWTERDTIEAEMEAKFNELKGFYSDLAKLKG